MVRVTVNGEPRKIERGTTLEALLDQLEMERRGLAIAVDDEVVPRSTWDVRELGEGSRVEILSIAQGG